MPIRYDNPTEVGADRVVNAVSARERFGAPVIVVDFGIATTFDVVNAAGEYVGGIIAPGIMISAEVLFAHASRLYRVDIRKLGELIGKNTAARAIARAWRRAAKQRSSKGEQRPSRARLESARSRLARPPCRLPLRRWWEARPHSRLRLSLCENCGRVTRLASRVTPDPGPAGHGAWPESHQSRRTEAEVEIVAPAQSSHAADELPMTGGSLAIVEILRGGVPVASQNEMVELLV
jgi:hypothetical protein